MMDLPKNKMILINPPTTDPQEKDFYFPLALITLGGVLKELNVEAILWDFDLYFKRIANTTESKFKKLIRAGVKGSDTHVYGISSICSNFPMALWIAREIKNCQPESFIILGGPQPSSVYLQILDRFPFVDAVVVGEGEITLKEMAQKNFNPSQMADIPGVATRINGKPVFLQKRELAPQLDELPMPDYSLVCMDDYREIMHGPFYANVEVGRGCPFKCTFCSTSLMWEKKFRVKSPARIFAEMDLLNKNYQVKQFCFVHDNFTSSRKFVLDFCDFMEKNNSKNFEWYASSRTDCLNIERLERMHSTGLRGLFFGIESGTPRMQKIIKKNLDFEYFEPILKRANELGIECTTAFILGFPEETSQDINETIKRALAYKQWGTHLVFFSKLTALSGTGLYYQYLEKLSDINNPSTISPQLYGLDYILNLIKQYPDLFSSYYHLPHPLFSGDTLSQFIGFAQNIIKFVPNLVWMVTEQLNLLPLGLFNLWQSWYSRQNFSDNPDGIPQESFRSLFKQFLNDTVFGQAKIKYPLTNWSGESA